MEYLEVRNIEKSFGGTKVLKNVGFALGKGQVLSIIGSSGGGKTTLLRCLNNLEMPDKGEVYLDGKLLINALDIPKYTKAEMRDKRLRFGLVFQQFNLFPQYNLLDNVELAPKLLLREKNGKRISAEELRQIDENAKRIINDVGLGDKMQHYPCQLSGGQQQRAAIARALALNPDILCFDEPTSALDPELTGEVLRVIRELKREGRTMIIVTHEMGFAREISDKVIFVSDGYITEEGSPDTVFTHPKSVALQNFLSKSIENRGI